MDYANLLGLVVQILGAFHEANQVKLPAEIATATLSLIAALEAHKNDVVTKANLESLRG